MKCLQTHDDDADDENWLRRKKETFLIFFVNMEKFLHVDKKCDFKTVNFFHQSLIKE